MTQLFNLRKNIEVTMDNEGHVQVVETETQTEANHETFIITQLEQNVHNLREQIKIYDEQLQEEKARKAELELQQANRTNSSRSKREVTITYEQFPSKSKFLKNSSKLLDAQNASEELPRNKYSYAYPLLLSS